MARQVKILTNKSKKKIKHWLENNNIDEDSYLSNELYNIITFDFKSLKDCAESVIVDFYLEELAKLLPELNNNYISIKKEFFNKLKEKTRRRLANKYAPDKSFSDNIDAYFYNVKREYILHPMGESEDMEFIPENKDIFIKNNLKLVIECAKRYQNLGLPFEDLIQIGNVGLLVAFDKFDTSRANLQYAILEDISKFEGSSFTYDEAKEIIVNNFSYTKLLDQTISKIPKEGFNNKIDFEDWTHANIKKASFSSIAFAWIRAEILLELNKYANVIKVPKSTKNVNPSLNIIRLDSINPHTDDAYHDNQISEVANDEFAIEDESTEYVEKQDVMRDILENLMSNLSGLDRRILKKRYGIGYPFQLSLNEIAESESISTNKVKYSISNSIKLISEKIPENRRKFISEILG